MMKFAGTLVARHMRLLCVALLFAASPGHSQTGDWPNKPVRLVVPYPPGGATDAAARYYAGRLSTVLHQQVVVDNRAGATGAIGTQYVATSPADGYTLILVTAENLSAIPLLYKSVRFDPVNDFVAIAKIVDVSIMAASSKFDSFSDLVAKAKAQPGAVSYATGGTGSVAHLTGELLQQKEHIKLLHVPFKGSAPAVQSLIAKDVDMQIDSDLTFAPLVRANRTKALVVFSPKRLASLPEVPTAAEVGLGDFTVSTWFGIFAPAKTPQPIVRRLEAELKKIGEDGETKKFMDGVGLTASFGSAEAVGKLVESANTRYSKIIRENDIRLD